MRLNNFWNIAEPPVLLPVVSVYVFSIIHIQNLFKLQTGWNQCERMGTGNGTRISGVQDSTVRGRWFKWRLRFVRRDSWGVGSFWAVLTSGEWGSIVGVVCESLDAVPTVV